MIANILNSFPGSLIQGFNPESRMVRVQHPYKTTYHDLFYDVPNMQTIFDNKVRYTVFVDGNIDYAEVDMKLPIGTFFPGRPVITAYFQQYDVIAAPYTGSSMDKLTFGPQKKPGIVITDQVPAFDRSQKPTDEEKKNVNSKTFSVYTGPDGAGMGGGGTTISTNKHGSSINADTENHKAQEENRSLFTTSLNFLQHYFIDMAKAVGFLPPQHVPNLPRLLKIGIFVGVIASRGRRLYTDIKKV